MGSPLDRLVDELMIEHVYSDKGLRSEVARHYEAVARAM